MEGMESSPDLNRRAYSKAPFLRVGYAVLHVIGSMVLSDTLWYFADLFAFQAYGYRYYYSTTSRGMFMDITRSLSLEHMAFITVSAFQFHTDSAIFLSLRPVILQSYQLHAAHDWPVCDACNPDKQVISGAQLVGLVIYHPWRAILHGAFLVVDYLSHDLVPYFIEYQMISCCL